MVGFRLKKHISDRKRFIHDEDFGINIYGYSKSQPYKHTAGIRFDGLVYIFSDIREIQNILKLFIDFFFRKTNHGTIQIYIFYPVVLHVETGSQLQKG